MRSRETEQPSGIVTEAATIPPESYVSKAYDRALPAPPLICVDICVFLRPIACGALISVTPAIKRWPTGYRQPRGEEVSGLLSEGI